MKTLNFPPMLLLLFHRKSATVFKAEEAPPLSLQSATNKPLRISMEDLCSRADSLKEVLFRSRWGIVIGKLVM